MIFSFRKIMFSSVAQFLLRNLVVLASIFSFSHIASADGFIRDMNLIVKKANGPRVIDDQGNVISGGQEAEYQDAEFGDSSNCQTAHVDNWGGAHSQKVIFGDGNPANGIEDDREAIATAKYIKTNVPGAAGEIYCRNGRASKDTGKEVAFVGTGVIVNAGLDKPYDVLETAGHVFYDPTTFEELSECYFYPGGRADLKIKLPLESRRTGIKKVPDDFSGPNDFALVKLPPIKMKDGSSVLAREYFGAIGTKVIKEADLASAYKAGMKIELITYDRTHNRMSVTSKDCRVVVKRREDFFYGDNRMLLHSCDVNGGGSGGAIVANFPDGSSYLIGIHVAQTVNDKKYTDKKYENIENMEGMPFDPSAYSGLAVSLSNPEITKLLAELEQNIISL